MPFWRGQKVVCVADADFWAPDLAALRLFGEDVPAPAQGAVYTVESVSEAFGAPFLYLAELAPPAPFTPHCYRASAFRPAVEPSIAVFEAILAKVNEGAPAPKRERETVPAGGAR